MSTKQATAKSRTKNHAKKTDSKLFRVVAKGYDETFETKEEAVKQANYLKKRAVKGSESVKIKVTEEDSSGNVKVIHEVNIKGEFYQ